MKIAVLGVTGFGGSNIAIELLNRGHTVTGISRSPEKLGKHEGYHPQTLDIVSASISQLVEAFKGHEVIACAFNPPMGSNLYKTFVETTRRIILAVKACQAHADTGVKYFITIGGTGSLSLPVSDKDGQKDPYLTAADSRKFWLAYRRATADSEAGTYHMEERIGLGHPVSQAMRAYRNARLAVNAGKATEHDRDVIREAEKQVLEGPDPIPDLPLSARASFLFFEGDDLFRWSFVSPPGIYRPGPRTGKDEVRIDYVPLAQEANGNSSDGNPYEGRLLGCSAADLAVAIADDVEKQELVGKHWSAVAELPSDERVGSYAKLS